MEYEETGSLSLRQDHGGELPVEMAVQDRERAMSACVLDTGCSEEESFSRERSAIPHCVLRGRVGEAVRAGGRAARRPVRLSWQRDVHMN